LKGHWSEEPAPFVPKILATDSQRHRAGVFTDRHDADMVAVLAVAAADGMGIPLSLGDPDITAVSAVHNIMATLRELIRN
jgi:hypothetical protein